MLNTIAWEIIIYFRFDESGEHEHTREKLQSLTCKPHSNILSLPHLLKAQMHILLYVQWKYFPKALLITRNIEITELNALKQGCHCISSANLLFYLSCYSFRTGLRDFSQGVRSRIGRSPRKKKKKRSARDSSSSKKDISEAIF